MGAKWCNFRVPSDRLDLIKQIILSVKLSKSLLFAGLLVVKTNKLLVWCVNRLNCELYRFFFR